MKIVRLVILLAVLIGGLVIGSLNSQPIEISLAFWVLKTTSGIAIIASLFAKMDPFNASAPPLTYFVLACTETSKPRSSGR